MLSSTYYLLFTSKYLLLTTYYLLLIGAVSRAHSWFGSGLAATPRCVGVAVTLLPSTYLVLTTYYLLLTTYYLLLIGALALRLRYATKPLVPRPVLASWPIRCGLLSACGLYFVVALARFMLPLYLQTAMGWSQADTGLYLLLTTDLLLTTYYSLLTTHYLLLTTYYFLLTTYYSLLTAY